MKKAIKWKKGRPLMICPECGSNSEPDYVDFSRVGKPATVVMKCAKYPSHNWAFEIFQAKAPDGTFYKMAESGSVNLT